MGLNAPRVGPKYRRPEVGDRVSFRGGPWEVFAAWLPRAGGPRNVGLEALTLLGVERTVVHVSALPECRA